MEVFDDRDAILVRYLLNELSKDENEEIEDEMILDPEFSERAQAVKTNLIESYVLDEMSADEKARFEKGFFIFPENRERVEDARAFHEALRARRRERLAALPRATAPARPGWLVSLLRIPVPAMAAAALILVVAAVIGFILLHRRGLNEVASNRNSQDNPGRQIVSHSEDNHNGSTTPEKPANAGKDLTDQNSNGSPPHDQIAQLNPSPPGHVAVSVVEMSGYVDAVSRGTGEAVNAQPVTVPNGAKSLTLQVKLESNEYFKENLDCSVDISNSKFRPVYPGVNYLKARVKRVLGKFPYEVSINIPTSYLKDGEIYYFRVLETESHTPFKVKFTN